MADPYFVIHNRYSDTINSLIIYKSIIQFFLDFFINISNEFFHIVLCIISKQIKEYPTQRDSV